MHVYCESCGERYNDENVVDCPHCGGDYCWRCKDAHIKECGERRAGAQSTQDESRS